MRAPWLPQIDPWEAGLKLTGLSLASGSIVFAGYMMSDQEGESRITGIEHLAIYSKPATQLASRQRDRLMATVDAMPVGSIGKSQTGAAPAGYEILEASRETALLRLPQGRIIRVSNGSGIAGLGVVLAIERQGDKWALVTEGGVIRAR